MPDALPTALLWLFVINLGIALGAGLYEGRITLADWLGTSGSVQHWNADAARRDDAGRRFWVFVTTIPLTVLTLANLAAAWTSSGALRHWWLTAAGAALVERVLTFSYFIPTMVRLMRAPDTPESAALATRWAKRNYLRHLLVLIAWLAALKAFSLLYQRG